jgi:uncharacterized protein YceK
MKKIILALLCALPLAACGTVTTLEQACADHGGVKPNSIERENDGGAEARCNDNSEAERDGPANTTSWVVEAE